MKYELDTGEKLIEKEARKYKRISEDRKKNIAGYRINRCIWS